MRTDGAKSDWVRQPLGWCIWWGVPIAVGVAGGSLGLTFRQAASIWAVAFAWMGIGCLWNAWRCHRLHCYFSGPVLLMAAIAAALLASGVLTLGPRALGWTVWVAAGLVALSFVPELIRRKSD